MSYDQRATLERIEVMLEQAEAAGYKRGAEEMIATARQAEQQLAAKDEEKAQAVREAVEEEREGCARVVEGVMDDCPAHKPDGKLACRVARNRIRSRTAPEQAVKSAPALDGATRIARERQRQIDQEGWTAEHDDAYHHGELIRAAQSYLSFGPDSGPPESWPWPPEWWKPSTDRVRNLEKAGALIAAEIDRELRRRPAPEPTREVDRESE